MAGMWRTRQSAVILADLESDPDWWPTVLSRVEGGEPFGVVLADWCVTWGGARRWLRDHPELAEEVEAARHSYAERAAYEARDLADEATPENVAVAKLQGDRRWQLASRLNRPQWGETQKGGDGVSQPVINFVFVGGEPAVSVSAALQVDPAAPPVLLPPVVAALPETV